MTSTLVWNFLSGTKKATRKIAHSNKPTFGQYHMRSWIPSSFGKKSSAFDSSQRRLGTGVLYSHARE